MYSISAAGRFRFLFRFYLLYFVALWKLFGIQGFASCEDFLFYLFGHVCEYLADVRVILRADLEEIDTETIRHFLPLFVGNMAIFSIALVAYQNLDH